MSGGPAGRTHLDGVLDRRVALRTTANTTPTGNVSDDCAVRVNGVGVLEREREFYGAFGSFLECDCALLAAANRRILATEWIECASLDLGEACVEEIRILDGQRDLEMDRNRRRVAFNRASLGSRVERHRANLNIRWADVLTWGERNKAVNTRCRAGYGTEWALTTAIVRTTLMRSSKVMRTVQQKNRPMHARPLPCTTRGVIRATASWSCC